MSDINYIQLIATMKGVSSNQKNNTGFFDWLVHYNYMNRLTFCALIKHIFKADLRTDKISCAKDFISVHMLPLSLNSAQKFKTERNSSGLKLKTLDLNIICALQTCKFVHSKSPWKKEVWLTLVDLLILVKWRANTWSKKIYTEGAFFPIYHRKSLLNNL